MDKAKVSIIQAVAMSKANLTLDNDYLSAAYKALKWECNQADTFRDLYLAFSDDVKRFINQIPSAIIDKYTLHSIFHYHFAYRLPLADSINTGKKDAYNAYIQHIRYTLKSNEKEQITQAKEIIRECENTISEIRWKMSGVQSVDTTALKLENRKHSDERLLKYIEQIQDQEDNIAVYRLYIVLLEKRAKEKQAFINSLKSNERSLLIEYLDNKTYQHEEIDKIIKSNLQRLETASKSIEA